ncbi:MAG: DUF1501 domain-containing protein [Planctomycetaceae bacterium]
MTHSKNRCPGPSSRRSFLQMGAVGLGSFGLADLMRQRAAAKAAGETLRDKKVIFIWLPGGASHLETYDMKPEAVSEVRGELRPIPTVVPGLDICELLPLQAQVADKFNVIRSISHHFADHGGGHKRFMTGRDPKEPTGFINDYPAIGSMVAKTLEHRHIGLPNYVSGTDPGRDNIDVFSMGTAYLGPAYAPFSVPGNPNSPTFQVRNLTVEANTGTRLDDRSKLLREFDRLRSEVDNRGMMQAIDQFQQQAFEILLSDRARQAFDLTQESEELRQKYGRNVFGQRALLARRLVEAGVSFVTMVLENPFHDDVPMPPGVTYNWDSHAVNCHMYVHEKARFPFYDRAIAALVADLYDRGLDEEVMLIVTGEFGRTPRITYAKGSQTGMMQPGRDHWPNVFSLIVAGGGMQTGQVIGSSTANAEVPKDRPLTPNDLWATMFRHMDIDIETSFLDHNGRPMPILPYGEPITELLPASRIG